MALVTRRRFVQQTAVAAAALYGRPIKVLAETRRVEIKKKYDPKNVLRLNQNIKPDMAS